MRKKLIFTVLFLFLGYLGVSQNKFVIQNKKGVDKIKFKLINNLIIVPVEVNGVTLSFLLDTGVSKPIIFNFLNLSDTLEIKDTKTIYLRGLGGGESVEALKSKNNVFKIGDAIKFNQDLFAVFNTDLNLAPRLGVPVHGIIGYDVFKDFVVELNYSSKFIRLTEPDSFRYKPCKSCEQFNLEYYNNKPYIYADVVIKEEKIPVKLLIDSGGSDSLWLFEDDSLGIKSNSKYFDDFLGHALNGSVYGKRSRVKTFSLKSFNMKGVNVSYPDSESIIFAQKIKGRNGSLAGNVLKRFNVVFDYRKRLLTLKKNRFYKDQFNYNKSGIELAHEGTRLVKVVASRNKRQSGFPRSDETHGNITINMNEGYRLALMPAFVIVELRENSPAKIAGLQQGDMILSINGNDTKQFSLQQIIQMFYDDTGKKIKLRIDRNGQIMNFSFLLKPLF